MRGVDNGKGLLLLSVLLCFVELCGAVMRSHDSSRQWTFELVEEYDECEEWEKKCIETSR